MLLKIDWNDIVDVTQITGYHKEVEKGDLYVEMYIRQIEGTKILMLKDGIIDDEDSEMDVELSDDAIDGAKVHVAIYTDNMVEIETLFKNF